MSQIQYFNRGIFLIKESFFCSNKRHVDQQCLEIFWRSHYCCVFFLVDFIRPCIRLLVSRYVMMMVAKKTRPTVSPSTNMTHYASLSRVNFHHLFLSLPFYSLLAPYEVERGIRYFLLSIVAFMQGI